MPTLKGETEPKPLGAMSRETDGAGAVKRAGAVRKMICFPRPPGPRGALVAPLRSHILRAELLDGVADHG